MGVGIAHVNRPFLIHKNPVQPIHATALRIIPFRAVAFLSVARDQFQTAGLTINRAYGVAFGIRQLDITTRAHRDPLGAGKRGGLGGPAVAGESFFPRACFVMNGAALEIEPVHGIAFTQGEPHLVSFKINRPWAIQ